MADGGCREQVKPADHPGRHRLDSQPSSRTGENSPYGMIGGIEETSASFEARSAPRSYPTRVDSRGSVFRDAFAVRERLGDPRVVPSFHCTFLPGMPSSPTPGSPTSICSRTSMPTWPSPLAPRLCPPDTPAIRSARVSDFVASLVRFRYGLPGCSPPCTDRTGSPSLRGLLLPGFQRISLPLRCWI